MQGEEEFQIQRDKDKMRSIHPAVPKALRSYILVRGPDGEGEGKNWVLRGNTGDIFTVRFKIDNGDLTVTVMSDRKGQKIWKSGDIVYTVSFSGGVCELMKPDPNIPGRFCLE